MITLAICDDDSNMVQIIAKEVDDVRNQADSCMTVAAYTSSEDLLYDVEIGKRFDILLLDVEMPGIAGLELAKKIRKVMPEIFMVFVSSYETYVFDCFEFHPYSYIHKSQLQKRLKKVIKDILKEIALAEEHVYVIKDGHMIERVSIGRISTITREKKYAVFSIANGYDENGKPVYQQLRVRDSIKNVYNELPENEFELVAQSIVNLAQIKRIDGDDVYMKDSSVFHIARGKIRDFKDKYLKYCMGTITMQ